MSMTKRENQVMEGLHLSPLGKVSTIIPAMPSTLYAYILLCSFWKIQLNFRGRN